LKERVSLSDVQYDVVAKEKELEVLKRRLLNQKLDDAEGEIERGRSSSPRKGRNWKYSSSSRSSSHSSSSRSPSPKNNKKRNASRSPVKDQEARCVGLTPDNQQQQQQQQRQQQSPQPKTHEPINVAMNNPEKQVVRVIRDLGNNNNSYHNNNNNNNNNQWNEYRDNQNWNGGGNDYDLFPQQRNGGGGDYDRFPQRGGDRPVDKPLPYRRDDRSFSNNKNNNRNYRNKKSKW
jgi:hypothetical protein